MKYGGLENCSKWINWLKVPKDNGKTDKIPCSTEGFPINAHNKGYHTTLDRLNPDLGKGYVFDGTEGFFFVDIDNAFDGERWSPIATELCNRFTGCFVEVSQSGTGLHIIGKGIVPDEIGCKSDGFDLYRSGRFIALTGINTYGSVFFDAQDQINKLIQDFSFTGERSRSSDITLNDKPVPEYTGNWSDEELINVIMRSEAKNPNKLFGNNASFLDLWTRNADALGQVWPDDNGIKEFDHSRADMALCSILCFWTGNDHMRVDRLFRESGLMRDKWEKREDYRKATLINSTSQNVFSKSKNVERDESGDAIRIGTPFLTINQMAEVFKNHVYIAELNRVFDPVSNLFLDQQRFNAVYGGAVYCMDEEGKSTSTTAWNIITKCQRDVIRKASKVCFDPLKEYGIQGGYFNVYRPIETKKVEGDPSPFLNHLRTMFKDANDYKIIVSYMAAIIQYKGVKFSWAPVIQGVQGNGKTLINDCMYECIGQEYATTTKGESLGKEFNAFMMNKVFIGVEEIYYNGKDDLIEALKPIITNKRIQIEKKGVDKIEYNNTANFILNTNHKDAIRKTSDDRRYAVFYTSQQTRKDLETDGFNQQYFFNLFDWLENKDGYAIINNYLSNYIIEDAYNPAKLSRVAPITSSYHEAITNSMTAPEQAIVEAVEADIIGFRQGLISSVKASELVSKWRVTGRTLSKIMEGLGYKKLGRFPTEVPAEKGRPVLWMKSDAVFDEDPFIKYQYINYLQGVL